MSIRVGDEILLEEAWEDEAGHYHDEYVTVARIEPDGRFKVRINGGYRAKRIQAWLNKMDWYAKDYEAKS